ncbi:MULTISPECIES: anaerobic ribonucleoside-triphosphate reductase [Megasphaera]|uniref:Anaerobic ribonucleoside-triphosphate reductase n=1 Tax=Megasphaera hutchinsoni TaxID=1588748 RepID=A0A134CI49_9FIRM|nr:MULTISPECIES: anaerobic ribonucleoside-triphosphate reductase [Megasphaera]EGS35611.1 anaerobic ribonucleoside-triphosphate reductase [Megasphaera sp. UPII 135-E]KXB91905.1 anaerobic ribonucleoside-triphosphate reductase [Megasphaera hutchinsoni]MUP48236.1 anaerobic ribonucleoside-triphosphate reductase [Veillonellaceae bacterium M2-8]MUP59399.1 anaerobic ribonucleoside-triphosphate reductase [Veillonellaceae bacterium M2-4]
MEVIKRNGKRVPFDRNKIVIAIEKAMNSSSGVYEPGQAERIAQEIEAYAVAIRKDMTIYGIEDKVYEYLLKYNNPATARAYENYKAIQAFKRQTNTTDSDVFGLLDNTNVDVLNENSNKNGHVVSTQRDLIAGEVSKDIARRKLIPADIVQAHDSGAIHFHDMDYIIQPMFNCCLINLEDMLANGTVINGKRIDTPKSFQVACTVTTQIIAQVASGQYGGQSINGIDRILAPYVRKSFEKYMAAVVEEQQEVYGIEPDMKKAEEIAWKRTRKEIKDGIQTVQYQINTLMTTNGQAPFVTLFMYFKPDYEYAKEAALITEELLRQRIQGIKNEADVYVTPAFPKLIYVLDEHNVTADSPYFYLTKLAAECTAKRMYPDYISAKKMKENYEGNVFSPMGCRSFLSPWKDETGKYKFDGRFNMGVVSINLPQIGILADGDEEKFFQILDKRLELCKKALLLRVELLKQITSDVSPIHWQYGAIARLKPGETVERFIYGGYATLSLGYIGMYEATMLTKHCSHTAPEGKRFALKVMDVFDEHIQAWKKETGIGFALYGTPAENLTHRFCKIDQTRFGDIENVTDKGYYTNSYHVDVREKINVFDKFAFESEFQKKSTGGCISYAEIPNMTHNIDAVLAMIQYIYDNISYAEFNTKLDYCHNCGFDGEIVLNEQNDWECPRCHNTERTKLTVIRRTCGYLGENFWNEGRTKEIKNRVLHI